MTKQNKNDYKIKILYIILFNSKDIYIYILI